MVSQEINIVTFVQGVCVYYWHDRINMTQLLVRNTDKLQVDIVSAASVQQKHVKHAKNIKSHV